MRTRKRISHALRHDPTKYGLTLDEHGFAPLEEVLAACNCDADTFARIIARRHSVSALRQATRSHDELLAQASDTLA